MPVTRPSTDPRRGLGPRRLGAVLLATGSLAACSGGGRDPSPAPSDGSAAACGAGLLPGPPPPWTATAKPPDLAYAAGSAQQIVAVPLVTLRAPSSDGIANKVLWVSRVARGGAALRITAHPTGADAPVVMLELPASAGPGEIYPSIVDVPVPGCWSFELRWGANVDTVVLAFLPGG